MEQVLWQASIPIESTRNGEPCTARIANLPAGRYRVTVRAFASTAAATDGTPVLQTIHQDFALPAPRDVVDVPFSIIGP
jgi:hypothetical protein